MTPNSLAWDRVALLLACRLLLRLTPEFLSVREGMANIQLEMHSIFVGVSFKRLDAEFVDKEDGASFGICAFVVPTDRDPAMVGSWFEVWSGVSDCLGGRKRKNQKLSEKSNK
jgi:hypothetical protein